MSRMTRSGIEIFLNKGFIFGFYVDYIFSYKSNSPVWRKFHFPQYFTAKTWLSLYSHEHPLHRKHMNRLTLRGKNRRQGHQLLFVGVATQCALRPKSNHSRVYVDTRVRHMHAHLRAYIYTHTSLAFTYRGVIHLPYDVT